MDKVPVTWTTEVLLRDWLAQMPLNGEALRFDLGNYASPVTRQMLQLRLRTTGVAFGLGPEPVPANVSPDGLTLFVGAADLMAANARVRHMLEKDAIEAIVYLRRMHLSRRAFNFAVRRFERCLAAGSVPPSSLLGLIQTSAYDQAIGALKFCLPNELRDRLAIWLDEGSLLEAFLSPDSPSLWSQLKQRELGIVNRRSNLTPHRRPILTPLSGGVWR